KHIGFDGQRPYPFEMGGVLEVGDKAGFAPVKQRELQTLPRSLRPVRAAGITRGTFDLDHTCPGFGHVERGQWPRQQCCKVEYPQVAQWLHVRVLTSAYDRSGTR